MRRLGLLPALALTLVALVQGQSASGDELDTNDPVKAEVFKVEKEVTLAIAHKDMDALNRIFADEMAWSARGDLLTKAQVLADLQAGNFSNNAPKHDDFRLHLYGNTAVLTGHSTSAVHYKGKISNGPRVFTNVYVKQPNGQWQLVVHSVVDKPE